MNRISKIAGVAALLAPFTTMFQSIAVNLDAHSRRADRRLIFQTGQPWTPRTNLNADAVMVYGVGPRSIQNLKTWQRIVDVKFLIPERSKLRAAELPLTHSLTGSGRLVALESKGAKAQLPPRSASNFAKL